MSKTYAIASAKGGVGKTTTVASLGAALAAANADVVVVDADIGMANLAQTLGLDPDGATLHDVLAGTAVLEDALYLGPDGMTVLPGSTALEDYQDATLDGLADVLETLEDDYEYVLLDTGAGLSHDTALPLELAQEVVLVSTPQPQALGDTDKTRELAERLGSTVSGLVLTRASEDATAQEVETEIVGRIPDDPAIDNSMSAGEPVVSFSPDSPAASAYRQLAGELFDIDAPAPTAVGLESTADTAANTAADAEPDAQTPTDTETTAGSAGDDSADSIGQTAANEEGSEADDVAESDGAEADESATESEDSEADDAVVQSEASAEDDDEPTTEQERPESDQEDATEETSESDQEDDTEQAPKSVGPRRTEDVPVSEAEPDAEASGEFGSTMADSESEDEEESSESESKGFFSRLLGR